MHIVEQLSSSHAHHQHYHARQPSEHAPGIASPDSIFDVDLAGLDDGIDGVPAPHERRAAASSVSATKTNAESEPPSAFRLPHHHRLGLLSLIPILIPPQ